MASHSCRRIATAATCCRAPEPFHIIRIAMALCQAGASSMQSVRTAQSSGALAACRCVPLYGRSSSLRRAAGTKQHHRLPGSNDQQGALTVPIAVSHRRPHHSLQRCKATDQDKQASSWSILPSRFNPAYAAIVGVYALLFALKNPYLFAGLSIATIIPQNSTTTSLNSLVILFYDSGLFMNFAEAVYCVRLVTWLSILCCLLSFSVFN